MAGDEPGTMDAAEVTENERVLALRLVGGADLQPEVPRAVLVPGVRLEKRVLVSCSRLCFLPSATNHVAPGIDELARVGNSLVVDLVLGHVNSGLLSDWCTTRGWGCSKQGVPES